MKKENLNVMKGNQYTLCFLKPRYPSVFTRTSFSVEAANLNSQGAFLCHCCPDSTDQQETAHGFVTFAYTTSTTWGWPSGAAAKFTHSTLAAQGSPVQIPGADMALLGKSHAVVGIPHIKQRKMGMDVSSGPVFLSKKRRIGSS